MDLPQARAAIRLTAEAVAHLPGHETGEHRILDGFGTGGRGVAYLAAGFRVGTQGCAQPRQRSRDRTWMPFGRPGMPPEEHFLELEQVGGTPEGNTRSEAKTPNTTANFADEAVVYCGYHSSNRTSIPVPSKAF